MEEEEEDNFPGAKEESKYTSLFKIRPNCILHLLFISTTACSTALHCPMGSQAAMKLLHDEAEWIQWTVLVGNRNRINVQALLYFHHQSDVQKTLHIHLLLSLHTVSQTYSRRLLKEVTSAADMRIFPCYETVSPQI